MNQRTFSLGQRRLTRRKALAGSATTTLAIAATMTVGCGDDDDAGDSGGVPTPTPLSASPTAALTPKRGGVMNFALASVDRAVPDPHLSTATGIHSWSLISNTAISLGASDFKIKGEVIESWETPSPTEYVFRVRSGLNWQNKAPSNGRAVTAEDIAYNIDRIRGAAGPQGARPRGGGMGPVDKVEVIDASRLKLTLKSAFSPLLVGIADFRNSMVPKDFAETVGFEDPNKYVGLGAYKVDKWDLGTASTFTRTEKYWRDPNGPYFDSGKLVWLPDDAALTAAFSTRAHDWVYADTKIKRESVRAIDKDATLYAWSSPRWLHLRFHAQKAPFNDPRVRRAIGLVLDYKTIGNDGYGDGYWDYTGPVPSSFPEAIPAAEIAKKPGWNSATKDADITRAKALMTEAGHPDPKFDLPILSVLGGTGYTFDAASRIVEQVKKVWPNLNATVRVPTDFTAGNQAMTSGDFVALVYSILAPYDPVLDLQANYFTNAGRNYGKFSDPKIDSLITSALGDTVPANRAKTMLEIQNALIDEHAYVVTLASAKTSYWANPSIQGFEGLSGPGSTGLSDPVAFADRYRKKA